MKIKVKVGTKSSGRPSVPPSPKTKKKKKATTADVSDLMITRGSGGKASTKPTSQRALDKLDERLKNAKKRLKPHVKGQIEDDEKKSNANASIFRTQLNHIRATNLKHDYGEAAMVVIYKSILDMVLDLIPVAEENYRTYRQDRSAYALNTYLNQAREIVNDMRSVQDFSAQLNVILEVIRRNFTLIVQNMIDDSYALKKEIHDLAKAGSGKIATDKIDELVRGHGRFLNESVKAIDAQLTDLMLTPDDRNRKKKPVSGTTVRSPRNP